MFIHTIHNYVHAHVHTHYTQLHTHIYTHAHPHTNAPPPQVRSTWATLPPDHESSLPSQLSTAIALVEQGKQDQAMKQVLLEMMADERAVLEEVRVCEGVRMGV